MHTTAIDIIKDMIEEEKKTYDKAWLQCLYKVLERVEKECSPPTQ